MLIAVVLASVTRLTILIWRLLIGIIANLASLILLRCSILIVLMVTVIAAKWSPRPTYTEASVLVRSRVVAWDLILSRVVRGRTTDLMRMVLIKGSATNVIGHIRLRARRRSILLLLLTLRRRLITILLVLRGLLMLLWIVLRSRVTGRVVSASGGSIGRGRAIVRVI